MNVQLYEVPRVEIIEVKVEMGFASSNTPVVGGEGENIPFG